jgi:hypothetical protein
LLAPALCPLARHSKPAALPQTDYLRTHLRWSGCASPLWPCASFVSACHPALCAAIAVHCACATPGIARLHAAGVGAAYGLLVLRARPSCRLACWPRVPLHWLAFAPFLAVFWESGGRGGGRVSRTVAGARGFLAALDTPPLCVRPAASVVCVCVCVCSCVCVCVRVCVACSLEHTRTSPDRITCMSGLCCYYSQGARAFLPAFCLHPRVPWALLSAHAVASHLRSTTPQPAGRQHAAVCFVAGAVTCTLPRVTALRTGGVRSHLSAASAGGCACCLLLCVVLPQGANGFWQQTAGFSTRQPSSAALAAACHGAVSVCADDAPLPAAPSVWL